MPVTKIKKPCPKKWRLLIALPTSLLAVIFFLILFSKPALAASRYWVGTSDGANTNDTANWSDSSGNACSVSGGASVPTSTDLAILTRIVLMEQLSTPT